MRRALPVAVLLVIAAATPARADRIDGNWCDASGHSLSIDGPDIKTPGGAAITGDYARHEFAYIAPKQDADSGQVVYLRLFDDNDMGSVHIKDGQAAGEVVMWHRCEPVS
jgi:hypothetical protein